MHTRNRSKSPARSTRSRSKSPVRGSKSKSPERTSRSKSPSKSPRTKRMGATADPPASPKEEHIMVSPAVEAPKEEAAPPAVESTKEDTPASPAKEEIAPSAEAGTKDMASAEAPEEKSPVSKELEDLMQKQGLIGNENEAKEEATLPVVQVKAEEHSSEAEPVVTATTAAGDTTCEVKEEPKPTGVEMPLEAAVEQLPPIRMEPPLPETGNTPPMPALPGSTQAGYSAHSYLPPAHDAGGYPPPHHPYYPYPPPPPHAGGHYPRYGFAPSTSTYLGEKDSPTKEGEGNKQQQAPYHPHPHSAYYSSYPPAPYYGGYHPHQPYHPPPYHGAYGGAPPLYSPERKPPAAAQGDKEEAAAAAIGTESATAPPSETVGVKTEPGEEAIKQENPETTDTPMENVAVKTEAEEQAIKQENPEAKAEEVAAPTDATPVASVGGKASPHPEVPRGVSPLTPNHYGAKEGATLPAEGVDNKAEETKDPLAVASADVASPPHGGPYGAPPPHYHPYYQPPPHYDYNYPYYPPPPHHYDGYGYPPPPPGPPPPAALPAPLPPRTLQPLTAAGAALDMDRKFRKNGQARQRSAQSRQRINEIEAKPEWERTVDEKEILRKHLERRDHKNIQSRQRAQMKKEREMYILGKPVAERTPEEAAWIEQHTSKRKRKHEGDRLRRQRIKELGISTRNGQRPGVSARGPLPPQYQAILEEKTSTGASVSIPAPTEP